MHDPLGDEMKAYEKASTPDAFRRDCPVYARIDGRGFSRFTRGMQKPFDHRMTKAMEATAIALFEETGAKAAYVQSDEISLVWEPTPEIGEHFFGGKPFKMCSVLAGLATAHFTKTILDPLSGLQEFARLLPHFDARVVELPSREEAARMIAWRGQDARRNAITMIGQSKYSHKSLQGVSSADLRARLADDGIHLSDYPQSSLYGTLIYAQRKMLPLSEEILNKIPEYKRPPEGHLFERKVSGTFTEAHPGQIENFVETLFEGENPRLPQYEAVEESA